MGTVDSQVQRAAELAQTYHEGQVYGGFGDYYTYHIYQVVKLVMINNGSSDEIIVAYLHDILEDTEATIDDLLDAGIEGRLVDSVLRLTRYKGQTEEEYLSVIRRDPIATSVKIADATLNYTTSFMTNDELRIRKYRGIIGELKGGVFDL